LLNLAPSSSGLPLSTEAKATPFKRIASSVAPEVLRTCEPVSPLRQPPMRPCTVPRSSKGAAANAASVGAGSVGGNSSTPDSSSCARARARAGANVGQRVGPPRTACLPWRLGCSARGLRKARRLGRCTGTRSSMVRLLTPNPSVKRTRTGKPRMAFISFWAIRGLPVRAAYLKR